MTQHQMELLDKWLQTLEKGDFHHGDALGADETAHSIALALGWEIYIHPCHLKSQRAFCQGAVRVYDPLPPLARNHIIVDHTELLIATPRTAQQEVRSGTWSTVRYAQRSHKTVHILEPYPPGMLFRT